jgi:hypothetical protein
LLEIGTARLDFFRTRVSILWRSTPNSVGDKNLISGKSGFGEKRIEQLSRFANEWDTVIILSRTWSFSYKHYFCVGRP